MTGREVAQDGAWVLSLPANKAGRDILVGDLHGETGKLAAALEYLRFDPARDRVIVVGDLVDRGPDSVGALELTCAPWFHAVRGNHEQMMIDALAAGPGSLAFHQWMANGGGWIHGVRAQDRERLLRLAERLPYAITLARADGPPLGIVHAEYPFDRWADVGAHLRSPERRERMVWGRSLLREGRPHATADVAATVHGHTPVPKPVALGNAVFIDTGAVYGGPLTAMPAEEVIGLCSGG